MARGALRRAKHSRRPPVTQTGVSPDYGSRRGRHLERTGSTHMTCITHVMCGRFFVPRKAEAEGVIQATRRRCHIWHFPLPLSAVKGARVRGVAPSTQSRPVQAGLPLEHEPHFGAAPRKEGNSCDLHHGLSQMAFCSGLVLVKRVCGPASSVGGLGSACTRRCPTAVMCWSEKGRSVARDAGLGKSGTSWCGEGRQGLSLARCPDGVEECAVEAMSGNCRNVPPCGMSVRLASRRAGCWTGAGRWAESATALPSRRRQGEVEGPKGGCRGPGWLPAFGCWGGTSQARQGHTVRLTRKVVALPLPEWAGSVSGVVRALAVTGVETK